MDIVDKRISDEAVRDATGKTWVEWFLLLDSGVAYELDHKGIVKLLEGHIESPWWRQTVSVEYEKHYGLRVAGQTSDGSFEVGAQRSMPVAPKKAWELLVSLKGMRTWLGEGARPDPTKGYSYTTSDGINGEFRVVKKMSHMRLSWQPAGWRKATTLQVRVVPGGPNRSVVSFHHEGLPGEKEREDMRARWQDVLSALEGIAAK